MNAAGLTGNTADAHRVLHLAADRGVQDGVDPAEEVRNVLKSSEYADAVARDVAEARTLGTTG